MKVLSRLRPINIGIRFYYSMFVKTWIQAAGMPIDLSGKTIVLYFRNSNRNLSVRSWHLGFLRKDIKFGGNNHLRRLLSNPHGVG